MKTFHKHSLLVLSVLAMTLGMGFSSCEESHEEGEFDNWRNRNDHYIDSIANVAKLNKDGSWTIYKAFNLGDEFGMDEDSKYYIYVQKLETGTGEESPLYNDSIRVHYSGKLIPSKSYLTGFNFGKSYSGNALNAETDVPALMCVNQNVVGFATAVMKMKEGDRWRVYVPYDLGYGKSDNGSGTIPAYSTLIFDMQLARIYKYGIDTDTKWW